MKGLADPGSYQRGVAYRGEGRVSASRGTGSGLEATVQGTMPYIVELWTEEGEPRWSCTCPAAEDGSFCKHCVAVVLTLNPDEPAERPAKVQASSRAYRRGQPSGRGPRLAPRLGGG